jgi:hypothetical protein
LQLSRVPAEGKVLSHDSRDADDQDEETAETAPNQILKRRFT